MRHQAIARRCRSSTESNRSCERGNAPSTWAAIARPVSFSVRSRYSSATVSVSSIEIVVWLRSPGEPEGSDGAGRTVDRVSLRVQALSLLDEAPASEGPHALLDRGSDLMRRAARTARASIIGHVRRSRLSSPRMSQITAAGPERTWTRPSPGTIASTSGPAFRCSVRPDRMYVAAVTAAPRWHVGPPRTRSSRRTRASHARTAIRDRTRRAA